MHRLTILIEPPCASVEEAICAAGRCIWGVRIIEN